MRNATTTNLNDGCTWHADSLSNALCNSSSMDRVLGLMLPMFCQKNSLASEPIDGSGKTLRNHTLASKPQDDKGRPQKWPSIFVSCMGMVSIGFLTVLPLRSVESLSAHALYSMIKARTRLVNFNEALHSDAR